MTQFKFSEKRKFKFNEVVIIKPEGGRLDISDINLLDDSEDQQDLLGKTGVIRGMSQPYLDGEDYDKPEDDNREFFYSVSIDIENEEDFEPDEHSYTFRETDLESTGEFRPRTDLTGETIRVRVDPETGEGFLVEDDD